MSTCFLVQSYNFINALDGFDYFSFCILIEKYNANDEVKHALKEKVSFFQVP